MSPNSKSNSDINQLPNDGTRARANTVASVTASSTTGDIVSPNPSTPNLEREGNVVDDTPAGQDDIATPPTQHVTRSSVALHRTLEPMSRAGNDDSKVAENLPTLEPFVPGDTLSSPSSVVTHPPLIPSACVEANDRNESPSSDPFEYDDDTSTHSPGASHEHPAHSDQVEENIDTNVAQQLPTSDQSYSDGTLPTNPNTIDQEDAVYSNAVQQSTISDQLESPGSHSTTATTTDSDENDDANVVQRSSTSDQSESPGSITADSATVDTTPTPADFSLDQFVPVVQALSYLSPPFTFDGDIVMPDGQDLKLYICEKGHDASFNNEENDEDGEAQEFDESKERHYDFRRLTPRVWNDIVNFPPINMALGNASQKEKAYREMKPDQFSLKPDLIAASGITAVIKGQLKQQGNLSLDTSHATLRVCTVGAWNGTEVSSSLNKGSRIGTIVLGLPVMSATGDIVVRKTAKSQQGKVVFDWSKQWMSQDPADVRPRWMYFPSGTRYTIENTCNEQHHDSGRDDVHFVIEYPVFVDGPVKHVNRSTRFKLIKDLVEAFRLVIARAPQDFKIRFILSRPAVKLGKKSLVQLEAELEDRHSTQPDVLLYKALIVSGLEPTLEHVDHEPINPVSETYPRVVPTVEGDFPARVRDEAKRVISLTYVKSKPVVLIGAPILDDAENVGGRVVMTVEISKAKESVGQKEDVGKKDQSGVHAL